MKNLLLGSTGYVGNAVAKRLLADGHHVVGIARQEESMAVLTQLGIEPILIPGGLDAPESVANAAAACDALIDVARHDFAEHANAMTKIRAALSPGKVIISTTGAFFYGDVPNSKISPLTEDQPYGFFPKAAESWVSFENSVLGDGGGEQLSCLLRPGLVYGNGGNGAGGILGLLEAASKFGTSFYFEDGRLGEMCTVHVDDLADLYVVVLNSLVSGALPGKSIVNAASGHVSHRAIAESVAAACGGLSVTPMDAEDAKGKVDDFLWWRGTVTIVLDNAKARGLGWVPSRLPLAEDLVKGSYMGVVPIMSKA